MKSNSRCLGVLELRQLLGKEEPSVDSGEEEEHSDDGLGGRMSV